MDNGPIIVAESVVKRFPWGDGFLEVLKGASMSINRGQLTILSGPSGSGKSTLLYIIGGLERPEAGEIKFEGDPLNAFDDNKLDEYRNRQIGFVFQMHYLLPDFTALENVIMPALIRGRQRNEAEERAAALLSELSLYERRDHYPNQLSGGEQQRVAVARALINSPRLILADEPTGNLDRENADLLLKLFRKLVDHTGVSILVATHDPELARTGDSTFRLYDGKIIGPKGLAEA